jgi:hypothetical protein
MTERESVCVRVSGRRLRERLGVGECDGVPTFLTIWTLSRLGQYLPASRMYLGSSIHLMYADVISSTSSSSMGAPASLIEEDVM